MIEIQVIRKNGQEVVDRLKKKNFDASDIVSRLQDVDAERRKTTKHLDDVLSEAKELARNIGELFKKGEASEATALKDHSAALKLESKSLQDKLEAMTATQDELLVLMPNLPHHSVPEGKTPDDNEVVMREGDIPVLKEDAVPHWDLARKYDLVD